MTRTSIGSAKVQLTVEYTGWVPLLPDDTTHATVGRFERKLPATSEPWESMDVVDREIIEKAFAGD